MKTLAFILLLIGLHAQAQLIKHVGVGVTPANKPIVFHAELGQRIGTWYFGTQAQWKFNGWPTAAVAPVAGAFGNWRDRFGQEHSTGVYVKYNFIIDQIDEHDQYMEKYDVSKFGLGARHYINGIYYLDLSIASRQLVCVMGLRFGGKKFKQ